MPQRKGRAEGPDIQHLTPKMFLPDKLTALLDPDSYQIHPSALHPRNLCPWNPLMNLITVSCSHRRPFENRQCQRKKCSAFLTLKQPKSEWLGTWSSQQRDSLMTWPMCSLCPSTQKPTTGSYRSVGNSYGAREPVSCSPKDRGCQRWDQTEKVE